MRTTQGTPTLTSRICQDRSPGRRTSGTGPARRTSSRARRTAGPGRTATPRTGRRALREREGEGGNGREYCMGEFLLKGRYFCY